jgi:hypothetical protein
MLKYNHGCIVVELFQDDLGGVINQPITFSPDDLL